MIYIRHLEAAPDDIEKDFDAALIRTHALTLASEALREAQVIWRTSNASQRYGGSRPMELPR